MFVCKCVRIRGLHKDPTPITIKSTRRRMEETGENEVACHRQDVVLKVLFYMFLKHLTASSAKGGLVRHFDSCGSIWGITGTSMSGRFWTLITSYRVAQVEQLHSNFTRQLMPQIAIGVFLI